MFVPSYTLTACRTVIMKKAKVWFHNKSKRALIVYGDSKNCI
ncbi:unnamed protein product [Haemonchus placei]|uniref:Uncharacterized protein n=1 Tax=Haemonchus placei TaxID=6290 RepID=A0A3P7YB81_HAEPC|nr:unnamed protein product [Haemonchus placei]